MKLIELDFTKLREMEASALSFARVVEKIDRQIESAANSTKNITKHVVWLQYANLLYLRYPELDLEVNDYMLDSSGWTAPCSLTYRVNEKGLTPLVPLMKELRDRFGKPSLIKNDNEMELLWQYGDHNEGRFTLHVRPGDNAKCERVKVGEKEIPVEEHERTRPIYEIQCKGAEGFADLMSQKKEEVEKWEEREVDTNEGD